MNLIQLFLPVNRNDGNAQPATRFQQTRNELVERFGGLTIYQRSPAKGIWDNLGTGSVDDMLVVEVMVDQPEYDWWKRYRLQLQLRFEQKAVLIRSLPIEIL